MTFLTYGHAYLSNEVLSNPVNAQVTYKQSCYALFCFHKELMYCPSIDTQLIDLIVSTGKFHSLQ